MVEAIIFSPTVHVKQGQKLTIRTSVKVVIRSECFILNRYTFTHKQKGDLMWITMTSEVILIYLNICLAFMGIFNQNLLINEYAT